MVNRRVEPVEVWDQKFYFVRFCDDGDTMESQNGGHCNACAAHATGRALCHRLHQAANGKCFPYHWKAGVAGMTAWTAQRLTE